MNNILDTAGIEEPVKHKSVNNTKAPIASTHDVTHLQTLLQL